MKRIDELEFPTPEIAATIDTTPDYINVVLPRRWRRNFSWASDVWVWASTVSLVEPEGHDLVTFKRVRRY